MGLGGAEGARAIQTRRNQAPARAVHGRRRESERTDGAACNPFRMLSDEHVDHMLSQDYVLRTLVKFMAFLTQSPQARQDESEVCGFG